jgi:hypothetical protein
MPLNSKQEKLLDMVADNGDDIEADVEEKQEEAAEIMHRVLTDPDFQDEELFERLGLEVGMTIGELTAVPVVLRDIGWSDSFAALMLAARLTAWAQTQGVDSLEASENHGRALTAQVARMQMSDAIEAARQGVRKDRREAAKVRRNGRRS